MSKFFLDEPEFAIDSADNFILTLKNNYITRNQREEDTLKKNNMIWENWENLSAVERKILQFIADKGQAKPSEIIDFINRSDSTGRRLLKKLSELNLICSYGTSSRDPKRVYSIVNSVKNDRVDRA